MNPDISDVSGINFSSIKQIGAKVGRFSQESAERLRINLPITFFQLFLHCREAFHTAIWKDEKQFPSELLSSPSVTERNVVDDSGRAHTSF